MLIPVKNEELQNYNSYDGGVYCVNSEHTQRLNCPDSRARLLMVTVNLIQAPDVQQYHFNTFLFSGACTALPARLLEYILQNYRT